MQQLLESFVTNDQHDNLYKIPNWKQCIMGRPQYPPLSTILLFQLFRFDSDRTPSHRPPYCNHVLFKYFSNNTEGFWLSSTRFNWIHYWRDLHVNVIINAVIRVSRRRLSTRYEYANQRRLFFSSPRFSYMLLTW